jgi:hypothetical protein
LKLIEKTDRLNRLPDLFFFVKTLKVVFLHELWVNYNENNLVRIALSRSVDFCYFQNFLRTITDIVIRITTINTNFSSLTCLKKSVKCLLCITLWLLIFFEFEIDQLEIFLGHLLRKNVQVAQLGGKVYSCVLGINVENNNPSDIVWMFLLDIFAISEIP